MTTTERASATNLQRAERGTRNVTASLDMLTRPHGRSDRLGSAAMSRRAFMAVIGTACTRHGARAGQPCWPMPSDDRRSRPVLTACGYRIAVVLSERQSR